MQFINLYIYYNKNNLGVKKGGIKSNLRVMVGYKLFLRLILGQGCKGGETSGIIAALLGPVIQEII